MEKMTDGRHETGRERKSDVICLIVRKALSLQADYYQILIKKVIPNALNPCPRV